MKILFVSYLAGFGGLERMLINLANDMTEKKHNVHMVILGLNSIKYNLSQNIDYHFIADRSSSKAICVVDRYIKLNKYIKEEQPDVIVSFMRQAAYLCTFMGENIARKTIYSERWDPYNHKIDLGFRKFIRRASYKRMGGIVFQSESARKSLNYKIKGHIEIIPNPVYVIDSIPTANILNGRRIVTVGRLHEQKNHDLLIDAFAMLPDDKKEYTLEIYGEGPLRNELQHKIDALGLNDRVFLMGAFSDVHKRIASATIFVMSSDYEGMPNALLEAMALGLPCISTDYSPGSLHEFMTDGVNGLIVPCGDPIALANAMNRLLDDENLRRDIGNRAEEVQDKFSPDKIYDKWEHFFYRIAGHYGK